MGEEFGHSLAGSPAQASQAVIQASAEAAVRLGGSLPPSIRLPADSGPWDYMMEAHVCLPAVRQGPLSTPRDPPFSVSSSHMVVCCVGMACSSVFLRARAKETSLLQLTWAPREGFGT